MQFKFTFSFSILCLIFFFTHGTTLQEVKPDSNSVKKMLDSAFVLEEVDKKAALRIYESAVLLSKKTNYTLGEAKAYHNKGIVCYEMGEHEVSRDLYKRAVSQYQKINHEKGMASCYSNIGNSFQLQDRYDSALVYYQKAIDVALKNGIIQTAGHGYSNIGMVFRKLKQPNKAYEYYSKALQYAKQCKDSATVGIALINQGTILDDLNKKDAFYQKQLQALRIGELSHNIYILKLASFNIGEYFSYKKDYGSAIKFGEKSLQYAIKLDIPYETERIKPILARYYFLNGDYKKAESLLFAVLEQSKKLEVTDITLDTYSILQEYYEKRGNYKQAYHYQALNRKLNDKIFGEKQVKSIHELEVKYQTAQKDGQLIQKKLQLAQKDIALKQKSRVILASIAGIILLVIASAFLYINYRDKIKLQNQQLQLLEQEKEINVLEAMITGEEKERLRIAKELHDGVGGLLSATKMHFRAISNETPDLQKDRRFAQALGLLDDSAGEIRKAAHNMMPELLVKYGLIEALSHFCNRISSTSIAIKFVALGDMPAFKQSFEISMYRSVQELVNNVIKHSGASEAIVQISCRDQLLNITVEDDGNGFDHNTENLHGIGLSTLYSRVKVFNGNIRIDSEEKSGTTVYLEFDVKKLAMSTELV